MSQFPYLVTVYDQTMELLAADPIHAATVLALQKSPGRRRQFPKPNKRTVYEVQLVGSRIRHRVTHKEVVALLAQRKTTQKS